ncbi:hypothetical protein [Flagellimonas eckloniae]|uniref:hypothetical protein n=1 Tax=Flagellimonas eckloniae TaxID=346185 RepID=UPI0006DCDDB5|nr:hypothetical protein [Allomuricauda eckloniae]
MGKELDEFTRLLGEAQKSAVKPQMVWANVKEVDWDNKRMVAIGLIDELEYYDVLLGLGHIDKRPKVGSKCLLGIIGNHSAFTFLIEAEHVEEMTVVSNETELTVKEDGLVVRKANESLKDVLNDFIDEVNKIIVINGTTINKVAVTEIKQRLNTILK